MERIVEEIMVENILKIDENYKFTNLRGSTNPPKKEKYKENHTKRQHIQIA